MDEDSHLRAPWGTLLQPQSDPFTVQPRGFSRRLFLKGAAAAMAVAAMPRSLMPTQPTAAPAVRNLGPIVNATPQSVFPVEDFHPATSAFNRAVNRIREDYLDKHGKTYDDYTDEDEKIVNAQAEAEANNQILEENRDDAADFHEVEPDEVTLDMAKEYLDDIDDEDAKEQAFEDAADEGEHEQQILRALRNMKRNGYTNDELLQLTYEPDEDSKVDFDSGKWHANAYFPWKVRGPALLVHELMNQLGTSSQAMDDDGNELTDDLSIPEELQKLMVGKIKPETHRAIKQHLEPAGPDPLDRHRSVDMDELKTKVARSLQNFLSGKTVEKVLQATQKGQSGETEAEVRNLDEAIREAGEAIKSPITVYRPLDENTVPHTKNAVGHHLHDQAFLTGTTDLDRALSLVKPGGHLLAVEVQPGTTILKHEDNVVLPRHSRVRITDHATTGDGPGILKGTIDQS